MCGFRFVVFLLLARRRCGSVGWWGAAKCDTLIAEKSLQKHFQQKNTNQGNEPQRNPVQTKIGSDEGEIREGWVQF